MGVHGGSVDKVAMHDQPQTNDNRTVTRRRALAGIATIAGAGGVAGVALTQSEHAAAVSVEDFQVSDAAFEAQSVTPVLDATVAYDYSVKQASSIHTALQAGGENIATETLRTSSAELSNTTELSGNVLDSPAYGQSDFSVPAGETTTVEVDVGVVFEVRYDEEVVAEASASDTAGVEVVSPESGGPATIGGSASFRASNE